MNFRIVTQQQDGFPILLFLVFQCLAFQILEMVLSTFAHAGNRTSRQGYLPG